jgi:hypothetical protein
MSQTGIGLRPIHREDFMKKAKKQNAKGSFALESLEHRRMLYAAGMPALVGLNDLRTDYPTLRGQGRAVVVMDTGVNGINYGNNNFVHPTFTRPDGSSAVWTNPDPLDPKQHGWNYLDNNSDCQDTYGHGTGIATILVSQPHSVDEDGGGPAPTGTYQGVVPDAEVIPLKLYNVVSNVAHWATKQNLNAAYKWVYDNAIQYNIDSIVMDWSFFGATRTTGDGNPSLDDYTYDPDGAGSADHSIEWYIDNLRTAKNVLTVQAAGNSDNNAWANPGKESGETAVSSMNKDGSGVWDDTPGSEVFNTGAAYGQDANYVDIYAPGWNIIASSTSSAYYLSAGPTSFATPWIAGAAALLKQIKPDITPDQIMTNLRANNSGNITDSRSTWTDPILNLKSAAVATIAQLPVSASSIGFTGSSNDIKFDSSGNLHMVWYSDTAKMLFYSKRTGSTWSTPEVVDSGKAVTGSGASQDVGVYLSLALDSSGKPAVAYYDPWNADLRYATRSSGAWVVTAVDADTVNKVGYYPSLKIPTSNNRAVISYYDSTNTNLKFAQLNSGLTSWVVSVAYSGGSSDVGRYSRVALDPTPGRWVIAFDNSTAGSGMYTHQASDGSWSTTPTQIDLILTDVAYTDLQFDASNVPAVSYYDTNNGDLKFAYADQAAGTSWQNEIVDSHLTRGLYTNLHYAGLSGGVAAWDIIYYNKTGGTVVKSSGTFAQLNILLNTTPAVLETDGGANVTAAWLSTGYTIAYSKNDGTGLKVADF